jgi:hypothetical protein
MRFTLLIACAGVILVGLLIYMGGKVTLKGLPGVNEVKIEFPIPGTTLVKINDKPDKASLLLAASDLWTNTGINLQPKESVIFSASGRVNLAIHRLTEACLLDVRPRHLWLGPDGQKAGLQEVKQSYEKRLLICPEADTGTLLACLHQEGDPKPGKNNPRPDNIIVVGSNCRIENKTDTECTLWLVVNDAVLQDDEVSRRAYLKIEDDNDPKIYSPPQGFAYNANDPRSWPPIQKWKYIVKHQYWQIWYDDNIGFYQVQIDFDR